MSVEKINTVIVGAGQAGIAMSEHLAQMGVPHVVLERSRIAERWRSSAGIRLWRTGQPGMIASRR